MTKIEATLRYGEIEIYAYDHAEDPIICAGISAILETAILGLQAMALTFPDKVSCEINDLKEETYFKDI